MRKGFKALVRPQEVEVEIPKSEILHDQIRQLQDFVFTLVHGVPLIEDLRRALLTHFSGFQWE